MTPAEHCIHALALSETATDPRDVAVYRAVAAAWARIGGPAAPWSHEPARRQLMQLHTDCQQPLPAAPIKSVAPCQIERAEHAPIVTIAF